MRGAATDSHQREMITDGGWGVGSAKAEGVSSYGNLGWKSLNDVILDVIGLIRGQDYTVTLNPCLQRIIKLQEQLKEKERHDHSYQREQSLGEKGSKPGPSLTRERVYL